MKIKQILFIMLVMLISTHQKAAVTPVFKERYQEAKEKAGAAVHTVARTTRRGLQKTKAALVTPVQKVKHYFADPALGGVSYYASMAVDAQPIKENIPGSYAINATYYKYYPRTVRQWLQRQGTHVEFNNWWTKISTWYKQETGEYDGADIKKFVMAHALDMTDYVIEDPAGYEDFNHFFYRQLKNGARKIDARDEVVCSPADAKVRVLSDVSSSSKFFIKQRPFNLKEFLQDDELAALYVGGMLLVFRLAPRDYHRFHFPFDCTPSLPLFLKGEYETVSPIAFRAGLWPISINKRARIMLHSTIFGDVVMMVVGASMVASLNFTYAPDAPVEKGAEAGFFAFGGSTVCLLFKKDTISVPDVLLIRSENRQLGAKNPTAYETATAFETAVRMGQGVGIKAGCAGSNLLSDARYVSCIDKHNKDMLLDLEGVQIPFTGNTTIRSKKQITF